MTPQEAIRSLGKQAGDREKTTTTIERTARMAGLTFSRCFEIYYGRAKVRWEEMQRIETALAAKEKRERANEIADLRARIAIVAARCALADEQFHQQDIAALREAVNRLG